MGLLWVVVGCGGAASSDKPPAEPTSASSVASAGSGSESPPQQESPAAEAEGVIPTQCARAGDVCTPGAKFVQRLCKGNFPSVALYLFQKQMPWTRGYLRGETEAWNASGGASESGKLAFDEEVIILRKRAADTGGMQVSGAGGGYDALRWNGSCVTLAAEEVTLDAPPKPKAAKVEFRWLDTAVQDSLRKDSALDAAVTERKRECKGAHSGEVSLKCVKADAKLSDGIVDFVRKGGAIATPEKAP
jgi:hypothetical protein